VIRDRARLRWWRRVGPWFEPSRTDRVLGGVAGGLAERLGVDSIVVRLSFVVLSLAGGFGVVLYAVLWLAGSRRAVRTARTVAPTPRAEHASSVTATTAIGLVVCGALLILRAAGLWFGDGLVWPVAIASFGSAVIWSRGDGAGRDRLTRMARRFPRNSFRTLVTGDVSPRRIIVGGLLVMGGMGAFIAAHTSLAALGNVAGAVLVTVAGLTLIAGPLVWQQARQLATERRERIRSEERAEVAAHLHDSVLQTLAMIQRSDAPEDMVTLARSQERELRSWLYGRDPDRPAGETMLSAALDRAADRVERTHRVRVQTVVVGDCPVDERLQAAVDAAAEAMTNAARHSGATVISVYAEAGRDEVTIHVRDEGRGFVPGEQANGHRGISESIVGRMRRNAGSATIESAPGDGTDVLLQLPRRMS
jgi:signal transduction histidine kinase